MKSLGEVFKTPMWTRSFSLFRWRRSPHILVNSDQQELHVLQQIADPVSFPLDAAVVNVIEDIRLLAQTRDDFGGMAAPQLGLSVRLFAYEISEDLVLMLPDEVEGPVPLRFLINPSYTPVPEAGTSKDWEMCYSVPDLVGEVYRYNQICYEALDEHGEPVAGTAKGLEARTIQHEHDHLEGKLILDRVGDDCRFGKRSEFEPIIYQELNERIIQPRQP